MDELQENEIPFLMMNMNLSHKEKWIQTRFIVWSNLKPWMKNKHSQPNDIFPLPWDENYHINNKQTTTSSMDVTSEDIENIRKMFVENNKRLTNN